MCCSRPGWGGGAGAPGGPGARARWPCGRRRGRAGPARCGERGGLQPPTLCSLTDELSDAALNTPAMSMLSMSLTAFAANFPAWSRVMVVLADDDPSDPPWPSAMPPLVVTASASWTAPADGTTDALMGLPDGADLAC